MINFDENAVVVINGHTLSLPEKMTMRCAIESFAYSLVDGLGDDEHGKFMTKAYFARLNDIRDKMYGGPEWRTPK